MQYLQYLIFIGATAQLIGIASYIKGTIKGNTKPNRVTWLLWTIAPMIATVATLSGGVLGGQCFRFLWLALVPY